MGVLKNVGRWIGSLFVLCDWHADGSGSAVRDAAPQRDDRGDKDAKRSWTSRHGGGHPLTPEKMAREPAATPAPPPKPSIVARPQGTPPPPPPNPEKIMHVQMKVDDRAFQDFCSKVAKAEPTSGPISMKVPVRYVPMLVLAQQFDSATQSALVVLKNDGHECARQVVFRRWCGSSPSGVVVWGLGADVTLRDLMLALSRETGGMSHEFIVRVVWFDGAADELLIDLTNPRWLQNATNAIDRARWERPGRGVWR